jgi:hypothetical protein
MISGNAKFIFASGLFGFIMGAWLYSAVHEWRYFAIAVAVYVVFSGIVIWRDEIKAQMRKKEIEELYQRMENAETELLADLVYNTLLANNMLHENEDLPKIFSEKNSIQ